MVTRPTPLYVKLKIVNLPVGKLVIIWKGTEFQALISVGAGTRKKKNPETWK